MSKKGSKTNNSFFEKFASSITKHAGSTVVFVTACLIVILWLISGPFFHFSDTWQLIINTSTTIITFLMVFLIQKTQNKDSIAIQIKLNELVASNEKASNRLVSVEDMTEEEIRTLSKYFSKLAIEAKKDESLFASHSIEEAEESHEAKQRTRKKVKSK